MLASVVAVAGGANVYLGDYAGLGGVGVQRWSGAAQGRSSQRAGGQV